MTINNNFLLNGIRHFQEKSQNPEPMVKAQTLYQEKLKNFTDRQDSYKNPPLVTRSDTIYYSYDSDTHCFIPTYSKYINYIENNKQLYKSPDDFFSKIERDHFVFARISTISKAILGDHASEAEIKEINAFILWHVTGGKWNSPEAFIEKGELLWDTTSKLEELLNPMELKKNLQQKRAKLEEKLQQLEEEDSRKPAQLHVNYIKMEIKEIKEELKLVESELKLLEPKESLEVEIPQQNLKAEKPEENSTVGKQQENSKVEIAKENLKTEKSGESSTVHKTEEKTNIPPKPADSTNTKISGVKRFFKMLATLFIKIAEFFKWLWNKIFG
jgi:hypothetical protein